MKLIRVACTGRVDLAFVHRAFANGADGVFIGGCWPGDCHYVTQGNYDALASVHLYRKLLQRIGVSPARLRLEWIAASEGTRYAELMNDFVRQLRALGPLFSSGDGDGVAVGVGDGVGERVGVGDGEPVSADRLHGKLAAVGTLIPYLKLVERERLRAPDRTEAAYNEFYASDETNRLFDELVAHKLATSQIVALLRDRPMSTAELSEVLGLSPSEVSRHMKSSPGQDR